MLPSVLPTETDHLPVLADEVLAALAPRPGETIIDCTFGAGGHSALLVARLRGEGKLIAIDRDPPVTPYFERLRRSTTAKVRLLHGEFSQVLDQLASNGVQADAILLDLGVSSMQLDRPERGFSYAADAALDMRMDPSAELTARDIVNDAAERDLRSEEHTSELQSLTNLVCRLLLEKKKLNNTRADILNASIERKNSSISRSGATSRSVMSNKRHRGRSRCNITEYDRAGETAEKPAS